MKFRLTTFTLFATVVTLVFLVLYWVLILPQFRELAGTEKELEQFATGTTSLSQGSTAAQQKRKQTIADLQAQTNLLLPVTDQQYDLSVQIEAAARNAGVSITSLTVNTVELDIPKTSAADGSSTAAPAATAFKKLTFSMSAAGSYGTVKQWIQNLTSMDRFVQLDQVSVTSTVPTDDQVSGQVTGFAYYLPK